MSIGKTELKTVLGKRRDGCEVVDWINLAEERVWWRDILNTVISVRIS
jgi:hypothetical protein